jgi:hypothetical protein
MPVISNPQDFNEDDLYVNLRSIFGYSLLTAVALAPDLGERYLDTVYQTNWVQDLYGDDVLVSSRADRRFTDSGTATVDRGAGALVQ